MTVLELVQRYLLLKKRCETKHIDQLPVCGQCPEERALFPEGYWKVKMSDAKLWLVKLQSEGKSYSSIHSIRGVVRPAFQMAVDDEILWRNPFNFETERSPDQRQRKAGGSFKKRYADFSGFH